MNDFEMSMNHLYNLFVNMLIKRTMKGWLTEEQCNRAIDKLSECKESSADNADERFAELKLILREDDNGETS